MLARLVFCYVVMCFVLLYYFVLCCPCHVLYILLYFVSETVSCYIIQSGLKLVMLLPHPSKGQNYIIAMSSHLHDSKFFMKSYLKYEKN